MKILVIGGGGREHALCWKLRQSPRVTELFCAPGNAGTEALGRNVAIPISDIEGLARFAQDEGIGLTVVGPDDALAAGIVDLFERARAADIRADEARGRGSSRRRHSRSGSWSGTGSRRRASGNLRTARRRTGFARA